MPHRDRQLAFWLSMPTLLLLILLGAIPTMWPMMSEWEGKILPVITDINVYSVGKTERGEDIVAFDFDKDRACEMISLIWKDSLGNQIYITLPAHNDEVLSNLTLAVGDGQVAGPFILHGVADFTTTRIDIVHRCNPLWLTYTHIYP